MKCLTLRKENQELKKEVRFLKSKKHEKAVILEHLKSKTNPATAAMLVINI